MVLKDNTIRREQVCKYSRCYRLWPHHLLQAPNSAWQPARRKDKDQTQTWCACGRVWMKKMVRPNWWELKFINQGKQWHISTNRKILLWPAPWSKKQSDDRRARKHLQLWQRVNMTEGWRQRAEHSLFFTQTIPPQSHPEVIHTYSGRQTSKLNTLRSTSTCLKSVSDFFFFFFEVDRSAGLKH